jgi:hypothetical protein
MSNKVAEMATYGTTPSTDDGSIRSLSGEVHINEAGPLPAISAPRVKETSQDNTGDDPGFDPDAVGCGDYRDDAPLYSDDDIPFGKGAEVTTDAALSEEDELAIKQAYGISRLCKEAVDLLEGLKDPHGTAKPVAEQRTIYLSKKDDVAGKVLDAVRSFVKKALEMEKGKPAPDTKVERRMKKVLDAISGTRSTMVTGEHFVLGSFNAQSTLLDTIFPAMTPAQLIRLSGNRMMPTDLDGGKLILDVGIGSPAQRTSSPNLKMLFRNGYALFGGQGGGAKWAMERPLINSEDPKGGSYLRLLVRAFKTGAAPAGYASKFNAFLKVPAIKGLDIHYYGGDDVQITGADGASYGWNIDHPQWATLLAEHGESCLQYACVDPRNDAEGKPYIAFSKGLLHPVKLGFDGPAVRINVNCVKGAGKNRVLPGDTTTNHSVLGIHKILSKVGTQQLGYQWVAHLAPTPENVELAEAMARDAIKALTSDRAGKTLTPANFRKRLINAVAKADNDIRAAVDLCDQMNRTMREARATQYNLGRCKETDPVFSADCEVPAPETLGSSKDGACAKPSKEWCKVDGLVSKEKVSKCGRPQLSSHYDLDPIGFPNVRAKVEAKLSKLLFQAFAGLGIDGHIKVLLMDDAVQPGTCVIVGADPEKEVGSYAVIWRSPHQHHQGNLALVSVAPSERHVIYYKESGANEAPEEEGTQKTETEAASETLTPVYCKHAIYMHPHDVAKINGDDDGDMVAISYDKRLVELVKNHRAYYGNALYKFEPSSAAKGADFNTDRVGYYRELLMQDQGAVGIMCNQMMVALGVARAGGSITVTLKEDGKETPYSFDLEGLPLAYSVLTQGAIDQLKKEVVVPQLARLLAQAEWSRTTENGFETVNAPLLKADEKSMALADASELMGRLLRKVLSGEFEQIEKLPNMPGFVPAGKIPEAPAPAKAADTNSNKGSSALSAIQRARQMEKGVTTPPPAPVGSEKDSEIRVGASSNIWAAVKECVKGNSKSDYQLDPVAWKWHGPDQDKGRVNPARWLLCREKDGLYTHWLRANGVTLASPIHAAHDAAAGVWNSLAMIDPESQLLYQEFGSTFAKAYDARFGSGSFKKGVSAAPLRMANANGDLTYLEVEFEKQLGKLLNAIRSAAASNKALGGDDDGGKALAAALSAFRTWVIGDFERDDTRERRPLTALECVRLGYSHEKGYIISEDIRKQPGFNTDAALKSRVSHAYNLVFDGSPLMAALGVASQCKASLGFKVTRMVSSAWKYLSIMAEESEAAKDIQTRVPETHKGALKNAAYLDEWLLPWISDWHKEATGYPLVNCRVCARKVKMAVSEAANDPEPFKRLRDTLDAWRKQGEFSTPNVYGVTYEKGRDVPFQVPVEVVQQAISAAGLRLAIGRNPQSLEKLSGTDVSEYSNYYMTLSNTKVKTATPEKDSGSGSEGRLSALPPGTPTK